MRIPRLRSAAIAAVVAASTLLPATVSAAPPVHAAAAMAQHACTRTSSGKCIKGGEFCPQAKYGKSGWDAQGRRYVCKGNRTHPHWEKP